MRNQLDKRRSTKKIVTSETSKVSSPRNALFDNLNNEDEPLLTKQEVADFLKVSIKTIDKKVCLNDIPYLKIGRLVRFSKRGLMEWISMGQTAR